MIPKPDFLLIRSLKDKKHRTTQRKFLVEGEKSVAELLSSSFDINFILGTEEFLKEHAAVLKSRGIRIITGTQEDIEQAGTLESNRSAIAVAGQRVTTPPAPVNPGEIVIALSSVRDPGNLGTILRIADWYGVKRIIASQDTAEFYNPKTIAASMGSFIRTQLVHTNIGDWLVKANAPIIGSSLDGENVHSIVFPKEGVLVMGNEANGIDPTLEKHIQTRISIPRHGHAESLNVAIATAVILDNWKR
ncbi:MAG TPA: RNA methyltransferase [Candidatus Paceibacterota bacterium]|nr:RNA methyltransferase [Candidatus Paceibacterota bacterium]